MLELRPRVHRSQICHDFLKLQQGVVGEKDRTETSGTSDDLEPPGPPAEERIRALLAAEPGISIRQLAKRAHTSESTASKWAKVLQSG